MAQLLGLFILAVYVLSSTPTWADEVTCDRLPPNSLARIECEHSLAARIKAAKEKEATSPINLGAVPEDPILKQHNVKATMSGDEFCGNPYLYQGQAILVRALRFNRVLGPGDATFTTVGEREILISGLPSDLRLRPVGRYNFVVSPLGIIEGKNAYGGPVVTPHALFLFVY